MIKKTLYFGNPTYLSTSLNQMVVKLPSDLESNDKRTIPIEDIGIVLLDNRQITITQDLLSKLLENNCSVITCNMQHMPTGLLLPLDSNTTQSERFRSQIDASLPLKKQMWQQTVEFKIRNQASVLKRLSGEIHNNMLVWSNSVRSGDPDNYEARAAAYYWKSLFVGIPSFVRDPEGCYPNNFLNYGYALVRATIARALTSSGLLPTFGIHHHNRYNAYCLADDIMEPYRPYVDQTILEIMRDTEEQKLTPEIKKRLLAIPSIDVTINGKKSPMMIAASLTSASVAKCFNGELKKVSYPILD